MGEQIPERFWFKPSDLGPDKRIFIECLSCGDVRGVGRIELATKAGDVPMREIEPKLRCTARLRKPGRPVCGGRGRFELGDAPQSLEEEYQRRQGLTVRD